MPGLSAISDRQCWTGNRVAHFYATHQMAAIEFEQLMDGLTWATMNNTIAHKH